jgi:hypothetical protein
MPNGATPTALKKCICLLARFTPKHTLFDCAKQRNKLGKTILHYLLQPPNNALWTDSGAEGVTSMQCAISSLLAASAVEVDFLSKLNPFTSVAMMSDNKSHNANTKSVLLTHTCAMLHHFANARDMRDCTQ